MSKYQFIKIKYFGITLLLIGIFFLLPTLKNTFNSVYANCTAVANCSSSTSTASYAVNWTCNGVLRTINNSKYCYYGAWVADNSVTLNGRSCGGTLTSSNITCNLNPNFVNNNNVTSFPTTVSGTASCPDSNSNIGVCGADPSHGLKGTKAYNDCGTLYADVCGNSNMCSNLSNNTDAHPYVNLTGSLTSLACGQYTAYENVCGNPLSTLQVTPTPIGEPNLNGDVCANHPSSSTPMCGQSYFDQCAGANSYTNISINPSGIPSINPSGIPSINPSGIHSSCSLLSQPTQLNGGSVCVWNKATDSSYVTDQIHQVDMIISDQNITPLANSYMTTGSVPNNNNTLYNGATDLDFIIKDPASVALADLHYFVGIYHDNGGDEKNWTLINEYDETSSNQIGLVATTHYTKDTSGNVVGFTTSSQDIMDNNFNANNPGNTSSWQNFNSTLHPKLTLVMDIPHFNTIMDTYKGEHIGVLWGVTGDNGCLGQAKSLISSTSCSSISGTSLPVGTISNSGAMYTNSNRQDMSSQIPPEFQSLIFYRKPQAVMLYSPDRPVNTNVGQGWFDSSSASPAYWNVSANDTYNYFNAYLNGNGSSITLPIQINNGTTPPSHILPNNENDYKNNVLGLNGANPKCALQNGTGNCIGYGPSDEFPDVSNKVNYVSYYIDDDGIQSLNEISLAMEYITNGTAGNGTAHVVLSLNCNLIPSDCNTGTATPLGDTGITCYWNPNDIANHDLQESNQCNTSSFTVATTASKVNTSDASNTMVKATWNLDYKFTLGTAGKPNGIYNTASDFGDGHYLMMIGASDNYSRADNALPYTNVVNLSAQAFQQMINGNSLTFPDGSSITQNNTAYSASYLLSDWYVHVNLPAGSVVPTTTDPKHLKISWCAEVDNNGGC